jgi:hypothetical protein
VVGARAARRRPQDRRSPRPARLHRRAGEATGSNTAR